jgi:ferredoxin-NADP reductase
MIKPSRGLAKLLVKKQLSSKVTKVTFKVIEPKDFAFYPGQFITILISDKLARVYSICSRVKDLPGFSMAVETGHDGIGANYIKEMKVEDEMKFIGPSGRVILPEKLPKQLYFFATGTGISPFIALFYELLERKYGGHIDLFYGVRREKEVLFESELEDFKKKLPKFNYKIYYSKPEISSNIPEKITSIIPNMRDTSALYFLCGHPDMAGEIFSRLVNNGINQKDIVKEEFKHPGQSTCA